MAGGSWAWCRNIDRIFEGKEVFEGELSRLLIARDSLSLVISSARSEPGGRLVIQVLGRHSVIPRSAFQPACYSGHGSKWCHG